MDFFLKRMVEILIAWYDEHYYPPNFNQEKGRLNHHIDLLVRHYNYDLIEGSTAAEKRVNYFNDIQERMDKKFLIEKFF